MSANVTELTVNQRAQLDQLVKQMHEANEKRFVHKTPVADIAALKAITTPTEGEIRQVESFLPDVITYIYNAAQAAPEEVADDLSVGGWVATAPPSTSETWIPNNDYVAGDIFSFQTTTDEVDADGSVIKAGVLYVGRYIQTTPTLDVNVPQDTTSAAALDTAELAKVRVVQGYQPGELIYTQADMDAIVLAN